ncbi:hypothetical protein [Saccharopolyspora spinosa]|uniref:hypothetical protein n=1 Tax=Saccharopolyspora spinosa TaxID=60894 RepID=UPI0002378D33|nr:hypothetical protein [Saccharopolyspora spinosa]
MTTTGARAPKRRLVAKVAAPVLSQGITAGTSLVLQVLAARTLGLAEFGSFVLLLALLVTAIALYTGWVGRSSTATTPAPGPASSAAPSRAGCCASPSQSARPCCCATANQLPHWPSG